MSPDLRQTALAKQLGIPASRSKAVLELPHRRLLAITLAQESRPNDQNVTLDDGEHAEADALAAAVDASQRVQTDTDGVGSLSTERSNQKKRKRQRGHNNNDEC